MIIITCEQLGRAYSIDSEGTLFYTPLMEGGGLETEDWTPVVYWAMIREDKQTRDTINEVYQQLIVANQALGWYYTDVPTAVS